MSLLPNAGVSSAVSESWHVFRSSSYRSELLSSSYRPEIFSVPNRSRQPTSSAELWISRLVAKLPHSADDLGCRSGSGKMWIFAV